MDITTISNLLNLAGHGDRIADVLRITTSEQKGLAGYIREMREIKPSINLASDVIRDLDTIRGARKGDKLITAFWQTNQSYE